MAFDYINEAFKRLSVLDEEMFDASAEGIDNMSQFIENGDELDTVRVIDPEAETDEDLKTSYVGKVITNCNVCHSHIFNNKEDIVIDSESGIVNLEDPCPYCGEAEGFTIIGEIAPFNTDKETTEEDTVQDSMIDSDDVSEEEDSTIEENMSRASRRLSTTNKDADTVLEEDFKEVSITTEDQKLEMTSDENGKVTVTTEPVQNTTEEETIVPVSMETQEQILDTNEIEEPEEDIPSEDNQTAEEAPESDSEEYEISEVDEGSFDELGESYFKNVYENVNTFKTTDVYTTPTKLIVEGIINFDSGANKKTGFIFEARDANAKGQLRFVGSNKHVSDSCEAFSLIGKLDNKKLFVESLKYNYSVGNNVVRGRVKRK